MKNKTARIKIVWIGKTKEPAIEMLTAEYLQRISRYISVEGIALRDETSLLELCGRESSTKSADKSSKHRTVGGGVKSTLVLMDSRGKEFSSEQFAQFLGNYQESNPLPLVIAIGDADGFGESTRAAAQQTISLGKMTLPHELARVVLLEQIYRAFTILKGHPYHCGH